MGLVSEYVHSVAHHDGDVPPDVKALAQKTWHALKRSAKAGPRISVSSFQGLFWVWGFEVWGLGASALTLLSVSPPQQGPPSRWAPGFRVRDLGFCGLGPQL